MNLGDILRSARIASSVASLLLAGIVSPLACYAVSPSVDHPLDALTPQEYWTVYDTLQSEGHVHEKTLFASVLLHEPDKETVLAWTPGSPIERKADVVLVEAGKSYAAVVDIAAKRSEGFHQLKGENGPFTAEEEDAVDAEVKKDPRLLEALKKRGITDLRFVVCYVIPGGYLGLPEQKNPEDRIAFGGCMNAHGAISGDWDREIGGIFFTADMTTKKVLRVVDYGAIPTPETTGIYDGMGGAALPGTKPIDVTQPMGPSFTIEKGLVSWQHWRFRFRLDPRQGPVLSMVSIEDQGKLRSVMYEGSLSEMYVPYQDPEETWNSHVFLDAGEYFMDTGLGLIKPLVAGVDCPAYATFFSGFFYKENGSPFERPQLACLFERTKGDPIWRHGDINGTFGRPTRELVLRTVATVGNYDYVLDWRFGQDGAITVGVGATGILEVKPVVDTDVSKSMSANLTDKDAPGGAVEFGHLVAPGTDAVNHDHFFSFRLDLDVDGTKNNFMVDKLVPYKIPASRNPGSNEAYGRHWIWAMKPTMPATEGEAKEDVSLQHPEMWRFASADKKGPMGYPTSFEIMAGETGTSLIPGDEWPQKRAGFSEHQLWVTPYEPDERYAAGKYVTGSRGTDGLAVWTKKNRPIMNTDIVAWYTMGFHHAPRAEDWPQMPIMWHEFQIRPYDFFPKNPTMDLPMVP
jgi:primary-amine oxidase